MMSNRPPRKTVTILVSQRFPRCYYCGAPWSVNLMDLIAVHCVSFCDGSPVYTLIFFCLSLPGVKIVGVLWDKSPTRPPPPSLTSRRDDCPFYELPRAFVPERCFGFFPSSNRPLDCQFLLPSPVTPRPSTAGSDLFLQTAEQIHEGLRPSCLSGGPLSKASVMVPVL